MNATEPAQPQCPPIDQSDPIWKRIVDIIADEMSIHKDQILPDQRLLENIGADSLDIIKILMDVEEKFFLEKIPEDEADRILTPGDLYRYVKTQLKG